MGNSVVKTNGAASTPIPVTKSYYYQPLPSTSVIPDRIYAKQLVLVAHGYVNA